MKVLFLLVFLSGCVTANDHINNLNYKLHLDLMSECMAMCEKTGVKRYTPRTGNCECRSGALNVE